jgi:hypothetical protein
MGRVSPAKAPKVVQPENLGERLGSIDWDFAERVGGSKADNIHPYPAKFIPEIPGSLLDCIPLSKGETVFDPFVGSGTTLIECQKRGVRSVGVDLNPIACLISRVKTGTLPDRADTVLDNVVAIARKSVGRVPTIPNLDHWFEKEIQLSIARLCYAIDHVPAAYHDILKLGLSSILVRISNQDSDTRYAAVKKNLNAQAVLTFFQTAVRRILQSLAARRYALSPAKVIEADTLAIKPMEIGRVGAIITSPPYPNAYEYWLYHKYRMYWLGFDPIAVRAREIGARAHFFKTRHHTADHFVHQMRTTFALIDEILLPHGYAAFVVGRSRIHGETIDNAAIIACVAKDFGFQLAFQVERTIAASRKSFNLSHANIKTESVLVVRR